MTYDQAVKEASRQAVEANDDRYVNEGEEGCYVATEGSAATIYIAEPCYESAVIAKHATTGRIYR